jgi:predicted ATPase/DNA-binding CsgD family transcriptional regulator
MAAIMAKQEKAQLLDHLTPRETDVLHQLARGLSNREIAQSLDITLNTTKWYLRQIYDKLGAQRRTEAVMIAREIGLLDQGDTQAAVSSSKHNLPYPTTTFIGRSQELADLENLLQRPDVRLITVTGTGGVGKTRLALEVARRQVGVFEDGVYFIPLATLQKPGELFQIVGSALDLKFHGTADAREQVLGYLRQREVLLVLDNFEHLLDEGAHLVGDMLIAIPALQILCTSRQRLNLRGETVFSISGLDYPGWQPGEFSRYGAVQLFMQRARLADPQIKHSDHTLQKVVHICRLVEGMPLAIELVANWIPSLSLSEISAQVESSLDILMAELHDLPQRQQSIRAVFEHSWKLLDEHEKDVFSKLGVFTGSFSLDASQAVANAPLRVIARLLSKSLLRRDRQSNRYDMHLLVRKFAREKLSALGAEQETSHRHAMFFSRFLAKQLPLLKGGGQTRAMEQIKAEYDNCYAAWLWAIDRERGEIIGEMMDVLYLFLHFQAWNEVGTELFQRAREQWPAHTANASRIAGRLSVRFPSVSDPEARTVTLQRGLAIAEHCVDLSEIAFCQRELGLQVGHRGPDDTATIQRGLRLLRTSLQNHRELGDPYYEAQLLDDIRWCYTRLHDRRARIHYAKQSFEKRKEIGDVIGLGRAVSGYYTAIVFDGNPDQAIQLVKETYAMGSQQDNHFLMAEMRILQGFHLMMYLGELDRAKPLLEDALRIARQINYEYGRRFAQLLLATITCVRDEDAEEAIQLIHDALPDDRTMNAETVYFLNGTMAYLAYSALQNDHAQLASRLRPMWRLLRNQKPTADKLWLLVYASLGLLIYAALVLTHRGDTTHAVRLLSLSVKHEMTMGFVERLLEWAPIRDLQVSLRQELGAATYDALWGEGKSLDLSKTVRGLAQVLGE